MPEPAHSMAEVLAVEALGEGRFRMRLDGFEGRSFGGQTLGCAIHAAARDCPERRLHALHACFLRPVPPERPVALELERMSDGRRLARRRVRVRDDGRLAFEVVASFTTDSRGACFQDRDPEPGLPAPEDLPDEASVAAAEGWDAWEGPLEWRWVGFPWRLDGPAEGSVYHAWVRPRQSLAAGSPLRAAALAYLSDFHSHWSAARMQGGGFDSGGHVSLDQAVWIHRSLPWDDWFLLTSHCDVAHDGRALGRRVLHARSGELVASMTQESLVPDV